MYLGSQCEQTLIFKIVPLSRTKKRSVWELNPIKYSNTTAPLFSSLPVFYEKQTLPQRTTKLQVSGSWFGASAITTTNKIQPDAQ
jgi:hypothetical protein